MISLETQGNQSSETNIVHGLGNYPKCAQTAHFSGYTRDLNETPHNKNYLIIAFFLVFWTLIAGWKVWNPSKELIYRDIPRMGIPNLQFLGESLRNGFLPFIHPRRGGGTPFCADPQTSSLYPPAWFFSLFPPKAGFRLAQFFHLWWLGLGFALFAYKRGSGITGSLVAGTTAIAAQPHIHALEWFPILAGMAWVPWGLLAAAYATPTLWGICLCLGILSGHTYIWIMTPFLATAGFILSPGSRRKYFLFVFLLVPLITAPAWVGYMSLASEMAPHGLSESKTPPVTAFSPAHLINFIFPKFFKDFIFFHSDGRIEEYRSWGEYGWARLCYLGLLPLLLCTMFFLKSNLREGMAAMILIFSGLILAMGVSWALQYFPSIFRHMHHPASFVQLTTWGFLLAIPEGWKLFFFPPPNNESFSIKNLRPWLALISAAVIICGFVHWNFSNLALEDNAHPLWNFSWRNGWTTYPLMILLLVGLLSTSNNYLNKHRMLKVLPAIFVAILQLIDLGLNNFSLAPMSSIPETSQKKVLPLLSKEKGRIWLTPDLEAKETDQAESAEMLEKHVAWVANSGFPNIPAGEGFFQLNDYNPPFEHPALKSWCYRLYNSRESPNFERLIALSDIEIVITSESFTAPKDWKPIFSGNIPPNLGKYFIWKVPFFEAASLFPPGFSGDLQFASLPARLSGRSTTLNWESNECTISLGGPPVPEGTILFLPWTPLKGWTAYVNGEQREFIGNKSFGLYLTLPAEIREIRLLYRQPMFGHSIIIMILGLIGIINAARRIRQA